MTEAEWLATTDPDRILDSRLAGSPRKRGLFACACCRRLWAQLTDPRTREVVELAESFLDGGASREDLLAAYAAAPAVASNQTSMKLHGGHRVPEQSSGYVAGVSFQIAVGDPRLNRAHTLLAGCSSDFPSEWKFQPSALRDIFGNPFRPVVFDSEWRTSTAVALAKHLYESRDFSTMPILADALQDAGCDNDDILNHCRQPGEHVRGCWVVDLVLGKS